MFPKEFTTIGTNSAKYFDQQGQLHNFKNISFIELEELMIRYFNILPKEAKELTSFLLPMLEYNPLKRATAK